MYIHTSIHRYRYYRVYTVKLIILGGRLEILNFCRPVAPQRIASSVGSQNQVGSIFSMILGPIDWICTLIHYNKWENSSSTLHSVLWNTVFFGMRNMRVVLMHTSTNENTLNNRVSSIIYIYIKLFCAILMPINMKMRHLIILILIP